MKKIDLRIGIIYIVLSIYLVFFNFVGAMLFPKILTNVINPIFWIILLIILYNLRLNYKYKVFNKTSKLQTIFIIVITYLILYFLSGLILGYGKNPIFSDFYMIIKNIWIFIIPIVGEEYVREKILKGSYKNKILIIIYMIIYIIYDINIYNFITRSTSNSILFKNVSTIILPSIASTILFTYLSFKVGMLGILIYRLLIEFTNILLPILPNLNWFIISFIGLILPFITYILIYNIDKKKRNRRYTNLRKRNICHNITFIILSSILILFIMGFFRYKPVIIMSNSMYPIIKRGDIVIVKKFNEKDNNLKEGEVIEFISNNTMIVHRIYYIERYQNGKDLLITKGDNNKTVDKDKMQIENVKGIVKFKIPKLGYIGVWLNEYLK